MATDDDDKRVKDMLGEASMADLARWFGLPSYTELEEKGKVAELPPDDPYKEARERRDKALSAVEPWFLAAIHQRYEHAWTLLMFEQTIDVKVRLDIAVIDELLAAGRAAADPREIQRPEDIADQMEEATPQALLRDLHRVESSFDKQYEVLGDDAPRLFTDDAAKMMKANLKLMLDARPGADLRVFMGDVLDERKRPWAELPKRNRMANRRIQE